MSAIEVRVPDIGDFKDVPVIDVLVKPGDTVGIDDSLITLESDKATMDVPAPSAGTVKELRVRTGDKVSEGSVVLTLEPNGAGAPAKPAAGTASAAKPSDTGTASAAKPGAGTATASPPAAPRTPAPRGEKGRADTPGEGASATPPAGATVEVRVPDIGDFTDVPVIEVFVKPGDVVKADDPLVTLESDKATMDVPSPVAGVVEGVRVAVGARVSEGTPIVSLKTAQTGPEPASRAAPPTHPT
ncbi:MAG TPA: biotin/lipoyl-containing protein, partial [Casimicrobiaceae bacterium]|nr:biotin/lipoyl-containing protein [Casimicrobiaceae bacterium]